MIVSPKKVSFQGEPGANSHLAIKEVFPHAQIVPCPTFEDAFDAVKSGEADCGMIPIQNSLAGRVAEIHHLLPTSGLHIIGEHFLPIHHQLMGIKGAKLEDLKVVQSHVQALGQCRLTLRKMGLKPETAADTAGSARIVSELNDKSRGALAPALAAEIYGLDILKADVEDASHNTTRFVVLSRQMVQAEPQSNCVTSFVFRVKNMPAALYKAMGGFATNGVNLTKLESYMLDGHFFVTQFYAEVDGHPTDVNLKRALEELAFFSKDIKILGVYPAHHFRAEMKQA